MDSIFVSEMIGTALLVLFGDGVVAAVVLSKSKANASGWIVIATGWAMAVMIGVFAAQFSGANINPAVTIGLATSGDLAWSEVPEYLAGQFTGAFVGAILVFLAYYAHWPETEDAGAKLAVYSTGPAVRKPAANLTTEFIGTAVLVFGVYAIFKVGGIAEPSLSAGIGPVLVAFLVWGIGLSLGGPTGYAINPARDLAPRVAHFLLPIPGKGGSDWAYSWIPVVGPIAGGIAGALMGAAAFGHL